MLVNGKSFISGVDGTNQHAARWVSIASELYPKNCPIMLGSMVSMVAFTATQSPQLPTDMCRSEFSHKAAFGH